MGFKGKVSRKVFSLCFIYGNYLCCIHWCTISEIKNNFKAFNLKKNKTVGNLAATLTQPLPTPQPLPQGRADSAALGMDITRVYEVCGWSPGRLKMRKRLLRTLREDTISWFYYENCLGYPTFLPKLL